MKLKFTKMQGCGNDYIYIDCFEQNISEPEDLAVKLSDRHFGVGGDGVILICPSDKADCKMRMFNLDGSEGNMCGNGIRCVGRYMYEKRGLHKERMTVETKSGIKELIITADKGLVSLVTVNMGDPIFECERIPVVSDKKQMIDEEIVVNNTVYKTTCVSVGNPHCVIFCDDVESIDVLSIGSDIGKSGMFSEGVNVEFTDDAVDEIAEIAYIANETNENMGARRLHTVMEKLTEDISFALPDPELTEVVIDGNYVKEKFADKVNPDDLDRFIL